MTCQLQADSPSRIACYSAPAAAEAAAGAEQEAGESFRSSAVAGQSLIPRDEPGGESSVAHGVHRAAFTVLQLPECLAAPPEAAFLQPGQGCGRGNQPDGRYSPSTPPDEPNLTCAFAMPRLTFSGIEHSWHLLPYCPAVIPPPRKEQFL